MRRRAPHKWHTHASLKTLCLLYQNQGSLRHRRVICLSQREKDPPLRAPPHLNVLEQRNATASRALDALREGSHNTLRVFHGYSYPWGAFSNREALQALLSGLEKGVFRKRGLFKTVHILEILENLEILEKAQTLENKEESDHFPESLEISEALEIPPVKRPLPQWPLFRLPTLQIPLMCEMKPFQAILLCKANGKL